MVVGYMISGVTYRIMRLLGLNRLNYFSLPNLLADRQVVPEFLQKNIRPEVLGPSLSLFLNEINSQEADLGWYDSFCSIHEQLRCNASAGAADAVLELLSVTLESP
jgi:lipid-A-disaccharide synthase